MAASKKLSVLLRLAAGLFSGVLLLVIAVQLALWGGLFWLNSDAGKSWLENKLSALSAESGYAVTVKDIDGLTFHGIDVGSLSIADAAGPVLEGHGLRLHVNVFSLFEKTLSLSAAADSLSLYQLPKSGKSSAPFSMPDIYFHAVHLEKIKVAKLFLAKGILGSAVTTAAGLAAEADRQGGGLSLKLSLETSGASTDILPQKAEAEALLSQTGRLVVNNLALNAPIYDVTAHGTADLNNDAIDFAVQGGSSSLPGIEGKLSFDGHLSGTMQKPLAEARGTLDLAVLAKYIPGDIRFDIKSDDTPAGHVEIKVPYKGNDVVLDANFLYAENILHLKDIRGTAPGGSLSGNLDYNAVANLAEGRGDADVDYSRYKSLSGIDLSGHGKAQIVLSSSQDRQALAFLMQNFSAGEVAVNTLKVGLSPAPEKDFYALSTEGSIQYRKPFSWSGTAVAGGNDMKTAEVRDIKLSITPAGGAVLLTGNAAQKAVDLSMRLNNVPLNALPAPLTYDALRKTKISGTVSLRNTLAKPEMKADLSLNSVRAGKAPPVAIRMTASYAGEKLLADMTAAGKGIKTLQGHADIPFHLSLYPFHADDLKKVQVSAALAVDMEASAVSRALLPEGTMLGGDLKGHIAVTGTPDNPHLAGNISLRNGVFTQIAKNLSFTHINMQGAIDNKDIDITALTAQERRAGAIAAKGRIGIGRDNMPVDLSIHGDNIRLFHVSDLISGSFSADAAVTGDSRLYTIKGKAVTHRLDITLPARLNKDIPQLNIVRHDKQEAAPADMKNVRLQMDLVAENQVFVRGWGLDAEFGGTLKVEGTLAEPLFIGAFDSKRGRFEQFGKRFDLQYAHLRFEGPVPPSPFLDVLAQTSTQDITAQIALKGNIAKPEITLSSTPPLPQDEVLSHILFGKNMTTISPFQAIELANTLQQLSGQGSGFQPLAAFRKATGLDDLQIEQNDNGTTTVGAGKYITDKIYLEAETGSGQNSGAAKVRVDLTPHVKAESKIGQDNETGGGLFWQKDY